MKAQLKWGLPESDAILQQLNWRYATKSYDKSRKISAEDLKTLKSAIKLAPSSYGFQPYKAIIIENEELRHKLREAAFGQPQVTDASHFVVFAYRKDTTEADIDRYIADTATARNQSIESLSDFRNILVGAVEKARDGNYLEIWNSRQAYIALGFLVQTAALLGIDASPMEGFDPQQFNEILGLEDHSAVTVCALGYRDAENDWLVNLAKVRKSDAELFEMR